MVFGRTGLIHPVSTACKAQSISHSSVKKQPAGNQLYCANIFKPNCVGIFKAGLQNKNFQNTLTRKLLGSASKSANFPRGFADKSRHIGNNIKSAKKMDLQEIEAFAATVQISDDDLTREVSPNPRKVYIIYAGGTIGMKKTPQGYKPEKNWLVSEMSLMHEFKDPKMPSYIVHEYEPLLDSSDMDPTDWSRIANDVRDNYDNYDGFVVIHGTDTMAYTASGLSFMLRNLAKPVILTGSQIPLSELRSDGRYNLITAVMIAGNFPIPEVCIFFDKYLFRGNRCKKTDIWGLKAFDSLNFPPLATVGIDINISSHLILAPPKEKFHIETSFCPDIVAIRMFPGLSEKSLHDMLQGTHIKGVVLEAYGSGNLPEKKQGFLQVLRENVERGVVFVVVSQAVRGTINMDKYATGHALKEIGVVSGYDMTIEAALTKLQFLFGKGLSCAEVKKFMKKNLAGELTPPNNKSKKMNDLMRPPIPSLERSKSTKEIIWPFQYHSSLGYFRPVASSSLPTSPRQGEQHSLDIDH